MLRKIFGKKTYYPYKEHNRYVETLYSAGGIGTVIYVKF